mmetsp:Transcript_44114/g.71818  ORF Transcript_44114/g.71818 Transcript_44114/m.71818 type:complete len:434 (+) Transcript_44114:107-1408(+)
MLAQRVINCFNPFRNAGTLFSRPKKNGEFEDVGFLDGLRFLGHFAVVLLHVNTNCLPIVPGWKEYRAAHSIDPIVSIYFFGFIGVHVMLLISGFLAATELLRRIRLAPNSSITAPSSYAAFIASRLFRLWPVVWTSYLFSVLTSPRPVPFFAFISDSLFVSNYVNLKDSSNMLIWSCCVVVITLLRKMRPQLRLKLFLALCVISSGVELFQHSLDESTYDLLNGSLIPKSSEPIELLLTGESIDRYIIQSLPFLKIYCATHNRFTAFLAGMLLAVDRSEKRQPNGQGWVGLALCISCFAFFVSHGERKFLMLLAAGTGHSLIAFGMYFSLFPLFTSIKSFPTIAKFLGLKLFCVASRLMLSMYLFHMTVMYIIITVGYDQGYSLQPSRVAILGIACVTCLLSAVVAFVIYLAIEKPFLNLRDLLLETKKISSD